MNPAETVVNKHLPFLDGIRGLAILLVLVYHCFPEFRIAEMGWIGVDLFFVLSGFLITGILLKTRTKSNYFTNFLVRRALRIFPLYYFFLLLVFVVIPIFNSNLLGNFSYYSQHQWWFWLYLQNWLYSVDGFPKNFSLHHLWSLAVEEQFYLIWPLVVYSVRSKWLIACIISCIVFANVFRFTGGIFGFVFPFEYVSTLARMDSLLCGSLTAVMLASHPQLLKRIGIVMLPLSVLVLISFIFYRKSFTFWSMEPVYTCIAIAFASLISICFFNFRLSSLLKPVFEHKWFTWLGRYSYGIYMYHYPVYLAFLSALLPYFIYIFGKGIFASTLNGILSILVTFALAKLSFRYIEKPFLALKTRFDK